MALWFMSSNVNIAIGLSMFPMIDENHTAWKCNNCGFESLADEVGDDWEENGCPGYPPLQEEN